ncbi:Hsp70 family protein [Phenylobacterium montanum]|uniref:Hsp70 family protein n=1 Tax=Phenylobacterium montanum TaxID=2823693 RepID=A0A975IT20_9CAUL|nr:Hsp70 family protein [Caulobacter sp. S6]QUD86280.1 Hsp70 family protein [Caulobacter sp. S6]
MSARPVIGVDFGTTNTVVSLLAPTGEADLVRFDGLGEGRAPFRSALAFHSEHDHGGGRRIEAGPWAIDAYLDDPGETRFIQSFKSYAASSLFSETTIFGRRYRFEDMLSAFLLQLRKHADAALAELPPRLIVGRPVRFVGANPDADLALSRYETAFRRLGFSEILYAYEPVAAAFFFAKRLTRDATVLVADFGGGTSDFSIIRFERSAGRLDSIPLAQSGVGLAGDAFDYRIIDQLVSPELGKGTSYRDYDNILPIPIRYYAAFARWDQLALLRASRDMRGIRGLVRTALEPDKLKKLVEVLDGEYGYPLYQSVSHLKEALSAEEAARFVFHAGEVSIEKDVRRSEFEGWIGKELAAIAGAVDEALAGANLTPDGVDHVFLTGGSSFVPAVRRMFEDRFGAEKLDSGAELESIAAGLSLIGAEADLTPWCRAAPVSTA